MKRVFGVCAYLSAALVFLGAQASTSHAQGIVVPAGTLLRCTLDEPNFSSATASVGDPVVCHLNSVREFGHIVFPRGSYLAGHLEDAKEPGHFFGKGHLTLQFDRIGLQSTDLPVPSKVIAAKGFKVNRKGEIVGHGHPTRDVVEWMLPPLWPWKVLMLPARGPRPALKGEEQITLRLMDDIEVPRTMASLLMPVQPSVDRIPTGNRPPWAYGRPQSSSEPQTYGAQPAAAAVNQPAGARISNISYAPPTAPANDEAALIPNVQPRSAANRVAQSAAMQANAASTRSTTRLTLIALKSDEVYGVTSYHINGARVNYVLADGNTGAADVSEVDWLRTSQLNSTYADPPSSGNSY